jgi:hypothetical protein
MYVLMKIQHPPIYYTKEYKQSSLEQSSYEASNHLLNNDIELPGMVDAMNSLFDNVFRSLDYVFSLKFLSYFKSKK